MAAKQQSLRRSPSSRKYASQNPQGKEVRAKIWLFTFMHYDLDFFDHETGRLESVDNPFALKVLLVSSI